MKEGYSVGSGHKIEFRTNPNKWKTNNLWNSSEKKFEIVPATFAYCIYCNAWGWAQEQICPENYYLEKRFKLMPGGEK